MSVGARFFLLVLAACTAGVVGVAGFGFSAAVDARDPDAWTHVFWALAGIGVAVPLWLPAVIPARHVVLSRAIRWLCACAMLLPLAVFARTLGRLTDGSLANAPPQDLQIAAASTALCTIVVVVLVAPELRRWIRRRRG